MVAKIHPNKFLLFLVVIFLVGDAIALSIERYN